jgi:putative glutamine amidotransferase
MSTPHIVITVQAPFRSSDPVNARRKNARYVEAVTRDGVIVTTVDETADEATCATAFASMSGLLLSGGADVHPARYGQALDGSLDIEPERDALEDEAFATAVRRGVPILGICRGLQAINIFSGGGLLQDVPGHAGASYGHGPAATHPLRVTAGTRLAGWLGDPAELEVNSYHHQGIRTNDLAPGLVASAWADSDAGPLVEGLESGDEGRFLAGIQCHPERTESTPTAFGRLFAAFVDAAAAHAAGAAVATDLRAARPTVASPR